MDMDNSYCAHRKKELLIHQPMPCTVDGFVPVFSVEKVEDFYVQIMEYVSSTEYVPSDREENDFKDIVIIDLMEKGPTDGISDSGIGNPRFVSFDSSNGADLEPHDSTEDANEVAESLLTDFLHFLLFHVPVRKDPNAGTAENGSAKEIWPTVSQFEQWILSKLPSISMTAVTKESTNQFVSDLVLFAARTGPRSLSTGLRELGLLQSGEQLSNHFSAFQTAAIWGNTEALREFGVDDPDQTALRLQNSMDAGELGMINRLEGLIASCGEDPCHDLRPFFIGKPFSLQILSILLYIRRNEKGGVDRFWSDQLIRAIEITSLVLCDVMVRIFGANIDCIAPKNLWRPLHYAASYGSLSLVTLLLDRGANPTVTTFANELPEDVCPRCIRAPLKAVLGKYRKIRIENMMEKLNRNVVPADLCASDFAMEATPQKSLLFWAVENCCVGTLGEILKVPEVPLNSQDPVTGDSLLSTAVANKNLEKMELLLAAEVCPGIRNFLGYSALDIAVESGSTDIVHLMLGFPFCWTGLQKASRISKSKEISSLLEKASKRRQNEIVKPALFLAASGELSQLGHLELGDDLKVFNFRGESPAQVAARNGQVEALEVIVEYGGDLWTRHSVTLDTILHLAAKAGQTKVIQFLTKLAAKRKHNLDYDALNAASKTPVHLAAENGHAEALKTLFQLGASCTGYFKDGLLLRSSIESVQAVLDESRLTRRMTIFRAVEKGDLITLKAHRKSNFDHYFRDHIGDTALMAAAQRDNVKILEFLLETCEQECRPLGSEVGVDHDADVEALLRKNRSWQQRSISPSTSYTSTFSTKKLTFDQWIFGNSEDCASSCVPTILVTEYAINHTSTINIVDGCCALHRCVEVGDNVEIARRLVNKDPFCVNIQEHNGFTPLHLAVILRRRNILKFLIHLENVDLYATDLLGRIPEEFAEDMKTLRLIKSARTGMPNSWAIMCDEEIPLSTADGLSNWTRQFQSVASGLVQMGSTADLGRFAGTTSASQDGVFEYMERKLTVLTESKEADEEYLTFRPSVTPFDGFTGVGFY